jgi:signal transduction histidine kinase
MMQAGNGVRDVQALEQGDRLASLGALIAGVAHEVNTPLGIGVSAASTLQVLAEQIRQRYGSGEMTRSDLERFIQLAIDSSDLVVKNLQRAAELMQSVKQVAVDQASGEQRHFPLKPYLDGVVTSLSPKFKNTPHRVTVTCPPGLSVDGHPGVLAQIVTNFIANSLIHGFSPDRAGTIALDARADGGDIVLTYRDDGVGIAPEHLGRVFEPFFTTRRGTGGSGLGLYVVQSLVTRRLGGRVDLISEPGRGVEFTVRFPARPAARAAA